MAKRVEFNLSPASDHEVLHGLHNGAKIYQSRDGKIEELTIKEHIRAMIQSSPIVGRCEFEGCGEDITQAEIDLGCANMQTCAQCVIDQVVYKFGFDF